MYRICFYLACFLNTVHFQINHQPDATIFQFLILTFIYSSTCFGRFSTHRQELNDCSGSLWFYLRIVVTFVLCSWSGRPACIWITYKLIVSATIYNLVEQSERPRFYDFEYSGSNIKNGFWGFRKGDEVLLGRALLPSSSPLDARVCSLPSVA